MPTRLEAFQPFWQAFVIFWCSLPKSPPIEDDLLRPADAFWFVETLCRELTAEQVQKLATHTATKEEVAATFAGKDMFKRALPMIDACSNEQFLRLCDYIHCFHAVTQ